ncbi:MAG: EamA family transporter [Cyclobacteriaceae bacterium]
MQTKAQHWIQLGLAIIILSSSGTIGNYLSLWPPMTILLRCVISTVLLWVFLKITKTPTTVGSGRDFKIALLVSFFLGANWVTYFYALALSNVAIGMLTVFTFPVMTTLLEPLINKSRLNPIDLLLALLAFSGMIFIVPEFSLSNDMTVGVVVGLFSAFFYAVRNILLKKNIAAHSGITLMYIQTLVISILLLPILFFVDMPNLVDTLSMEWPAVLILAIGTTAIGHTLYVNSFRYFTITAISIMSNLMPLLGIVMGIVILDQLPDRNIIIGGSLIMISVMIESIRSSRARAN